MGSPKKLECVYSELSFSLSEESESKLHSNCELEFEPDSDCESEFEPDCEKMRRPKKLDYGHSELSFSLSEESECKLDFNCELEFEPDSDCESEFELDSENESESKPLTKIVIRRLPPELNQKEFLEAVDPIADHDYFRFVKADHSFGRKESYSRAYMNFTNVQDVFIFKEKFNGYVFIDRFGNESQCLVEY